jgi:hypothetical protein
MPVGAPQGLLVGSTVCNLAVAERANQGTSRDNADADKVARVEPEMAGANTYSSADTSIGRTDKSHVRCAVNGSADVRLGNCDWLFRVEGHAYTHSLRSALRIAYERLKR